MPFAAERCTFVNERGLITETLWTRSETYTTLLSERSYQAVRWRAGP